MTRAHNDDTQRMSNLHLQAMNEETEQGKDTWHVTPSIRFWINVFHSDIYQVWLEWDFSKLKFQVFLLLLWLFPLYLTAIFVCHRRNSYRSGKIWKIFIFLGELNNQVCGQGHSEYFERSGSEWTFICWNFTAEWNSEKTMRTLHSFHCLLIASQGEMSVHLNSKLFECFRGLECWLHLETLLD